MTEALSRLLGPGSDRKIIVNISNIYVTLIISLDSTNKAMERRAQQLCNPASLSPYISCIPGMPFPFQLKGVEQNQGMWLTWFMYG